MSDTNLLSKQSEQLLQHSDAAIIRIPIIRTFFFPDESWANFFFKWAIVNIDSFVCMLHHLVDLVDIESDRNYHDLRQWLKFNFNKPEEKKQT